MRGLNELEDWLTAMEDSLVQPTTQNIIEKIWEIKSKEVSRILKRRTIHQGNGQRKSK